MNTDRTYEHEGAPSSLNGLLALIDKETASSREMDLQLLREQALASTSRKKRYIQFQTGSVDFALEIESVLETGQLPEIVPLPHVPEWIHGIIQVRGEIVSVIDLAMAYGLPLLPHGYHDKRPYLLFKHQDVRFCLIVDKISGTLNIEEQSDKMKKYQEQGGEIPARLAALFRAVFELGEKSVYILDQEKLGTAPQIIKWQNR